PEKFRERLNALETPAGGLPEEALFFPSQVLKNGQPPWLLSPANQAWRGIDLRQIETLSILRRIDIQFLPPWMFPPDWWMYQHDERHSGHASGASDIDSGTVWRMVRLRTVPVDGPVVTKPSIVDGKIYIGSGKQGGTGG